MKKAWIALLALAVATPASAQMNHGEDMSLAAIRGLHETVAGYIVAAAEQMPETDYAYKPTPDVRSFGELLGHVANATPMFCASATGMQRPSTGDAEKLMSKAEIVSAVKAAFAFCEDAYKMDAMKGGESVTFFGQQHTRLSVLAFNMGHNFEHYGNIVTYMRLKGMVPPSSQGGL